jgi:hypothetical protein
MDQTKLIRIARSFVEFYVIGLIIIILIEHFARHHHWGYHIARSLAIAIIPGLLGATAEAIRKDA